MNDNKECNMGPCTCVCLPCLIAFVFVEECLKTYICLFCCCIDIHSRKINHEKNEIEQFDFEKKENKDILNRYKGKIYGNANSV